MSDEANASNPLEAPTPGLRARTWLIGLPVLIGLSVISVYADMSSQVIQFGVLAFSPPVVVALFVIALVNTGWKSARKEPLLAPAEVLVIYAMLLIAVMVSTRGMVEKVDGAIAFLPYAVAHQYPEFMPFLAHIPRWIVPYNPDAPGVTGAVKSFYEGHSSVSWTVWLRPLAVDFSLFALVTIVFLCMGTILRRQWVDIEHLNFPLTSLPIALIRNESDGKPLLSSPLLWVGFAIPTFLFGLNGLHANVPMVPQIPTSIDLVPSLVASPWNQIEFFRAYISLAVIGFAYFMPSDILFSLWFFYLLLQAQTVIGGAAGYPSNIHDSWGPYEALGSYIVLTVSMVWSMRKHLVHVWNTARGHGDASDSSDQFEMMTYRAAVFGLLIGFAGIVGWFTLAGMNPWLALLEMGLYLFVTAFVMSRAVAQAGLLMTETSFVPMDLIQLFCPAASLGAASLTMTAFANTWFSRDLRGELLAPIMDTQRTASQVKQHPRILLLPIVIAVVIAFITGSITYLHLSYSVGALNLYTHPTWSASREFVALSGPINGRFEHATTSPGAFVAGAVVTIVLTVLRTRYTWFPFHPLGFALAPTWALMVFWFPFLIAWSIRSLVLRYGGLNLYRQLTPVMLGLIIGEFSSAVFWSVLNMTLHASVPEFPWP